MQQPIKPAVVLEDDTYYAQEISRSIRRFGGVPVKHFSSIENFYSHHGIQYGDKIGLSHVLQGYSVVVSDNNFENAEGEIRGVNFLLNELGPTLKEMKEDRPLVMCFAPSSEDILKKHEKRLWEDFGIVSFNKTEETPAIGLTVRLAREYDVTLNRQSVINKICGQSLNDMDRDTKQMFFIKLWGKQDVFFSDLEPGRGHIEGDAVPMEWEEIVSLLSSKLDIDNGRLSEIIDLEVAHRQKELDEVKIHRPEEKK